MEAEIIGAEDALPGALWTCYFTEEQGFTVKKIIMFQDNMSVILLEKNGRMSSTQKKKNIRVIYFLIKDHIAVGYMKVEHCPMGKILTDHFKKTLQGALFSKFCACIQCIPDELLESEMSRGETKGASIPSPQECVGKNSGQDILKIQS